MISSQGKYHLSGKKFLPFMQALLYGIHPLRIPLQRTALRKTIRGLKIHAAFALN